MSAASLAVDPFEAEDDLLVYRATRTAPGSDTAWFFDEVAKRRQPRLLLDVRGAPQARSDVRAVVYRRHRELDGRRIAIVGEGGLQEFVVSFLLAATGHRDARYFHDEAPARAWLREAPHA